jgi:hypothetical protein
MKSFEGYLKQAAGDTYLLLAGGGIKPLSDLITTSNISSQSIPWTNITTGTNNKTLYLDFPSFVFRDKNGGWILGKTDNGTGALSLGSAAIAQDVELNSSGGNITLKGSGLVGIGTRSPAAKLHTSGNTRVDFSSGYGTYYYGPSGESSIEFICNGTSKAVFGAQPTSAFMYNRNRANFLRYNDNGTLTFENYLVLHTGNAYDPESWIRTIGGYHLITVNGDSNTYYPVVMPYTGNKTTPNYISVYRNLGLKAYNYPGYHTGVPGGGVSLFCMWEGRANYWDGNGGYYKTIRIWNGYDTQVAHASAPGGPCGSLIVWLRGGGTSYEVTTTWPSSEP